MRRQAPADMRAALIMVRFHASQHFLGDAACKRARPSTVDFLPAGHRLYLFSTSSASRATAYFDDRLAKAAGHGLSAAFALCTADDMF